MPTTCRSRSPRCNRICESTSGASLRTLGLICFCSIFVLNLSAALASTEKGTGKRRQTACKPGSVPAAKQVMAIHLGRPLPDASRDRPGRRRGNPPAGVSPKVRCRPAVPTWSCSRWGLPCRPRCRERGALLPHPFALAGRRNVPAGGLLSVALSLGSPPPGVTRHRVSVEPGLSSPAGTEAPAKAAIRPSG